MRLAKTPTSKTIAHRHSTLHFQCCPPQGGGADEIIGLAPGPAQRPARKRRCGRKGAGRDAPHSQSPLPPPGADTGVGVRRRAARVCIQQPLQGQRASLYLEGPPAKNLAQPSAPTRLTQGQWLGLRVSTVRAPSFGRGQTAAYTCGAVTAASTLQRRPGVDAAALGGIHPDPLIRRWGDESE